MLVVDYGGVLTNPIAETIGRFARHLDIAPTAVPTALALAADCTGATPMALLERGELTETQFLTRMSAALSAVTGRVIDLSNFTALWFRGRTANAEMIGHLLELHQRGQRIALLTNNVREWRPYWTAQVPLHVFDVIVDSSDVGCRKPEPEIFTITTDRLGVPADECVFVDDDAANCTAARRHGMRTHRFVETRACIAEIDRMLARPDRNSGLATGALR
ncbi:HAD-IA family hydrolase [Nocardia sp. SYP-A9097]|nr:HAD-IA family hydrolase [Nocardia sp. SYP-A9097]